MIIFFLPSRKLSADEFIAYADSLRLFCFLAIPTIIGAAISFVLILAGLHHGRFWVVFVPTWIGGIISGAFLVVCIVRDERKP